MAELKQPIRICFVAPKAYPLFRPEVRSIFGGAELDLYLLARELTQDQMYQVCFITADYGQPEEERIEGVRVFKSLTFQESTLRGAWKLWQAMKRADSQIYMQESASPGTFLVSLFCRRNHRRFVYRTAHEEECNGRYVQDYPWSGRCFSWALRHADAVLVQNKQDGEQVKKTLGVGTRVIRNGHRLATAPNETREYVLWVARSESFKRPDLLFRLAEEFPDVPFVMICPKATGDRDYDALQQQAKEHSNLTFYAGVPFSEMDPFFARAQCFVSTSESEGFPNTFVQACKHGVPILSLRVNPDGFLDQHGCGVCAKGDWERFGVLFRMIRLPENQRRYGVNARSYVESFHDIRKIAEEYKNLFSNLVSSDRRITQGSEGFQ